MSEYPIGVGHADSLTFHEVFEAGWDPFANEQYRPRRGNVSSRYSFRIHVVVELMTFVRDEKHETAPPT